MIQSGHIYTLDRTKQSHRHLDLSVALDGQFWLNVPVISLYALALGGGFTLLGLLGLVPFVQQNNILLNVIRVDPLSTTAHLVTGLASLAYFGAWFTGALPRKLNARIATWYATTILTVYFIVFTISEITYDNLGGGPLAHPQWFIANGMHITVVVLSFVVMLISSLQDGARATEALRRVHQRWLDSEFAVQPFAVTPAARSSETGAVEQRATREGELTHIGS